MIGLDHSRGGFVVTPRKKADIYALASAVREVFAGIMGGSPWVPLDRVLELLPEFLPGFNYEVCEQHEMGADHGQTDPDSLLIRLREDVYEGMCRGAGRDRFTVAHELGHLFLHQGQRPTAFARVGDVATSPIYRNSEWQADTFASALLIDEKIISRFETLQEVQAAFGVSQQAAKARFKK